VLMFMHEASNDACRPFSLLFYFIRVNRLFGAIVYVCPSD